MERDSVTFSSVQQYLKCTSSESSLWSVAVWISETDVQLTYAITTSHVASVQSPLFQFSKTNSTGTFNLFLQPEKKNSAANLEKKQSEYQLSF